MDSPFTHLRTEFLRSDFATDELERVGRQLFPLSTEQKEVFWTPGDRESPFDDEKRSSGVVKEEEQHHLTSVIAFNAMLDASAINDTIHNPFLFASPKHLAKPSSLLVALRAAGAKADSPRYAPPPNRPSHPLRFETIYKETQDDDDDDDETQSSEDEGYLAEPEMDRRKQPRKRRYTKNVFDFGRSQKTKPKPKMDLLSLEAEESTASLSEDEWDDDDDWDDDEDPTSVTLEIARAKFAQGIADATAARDAAPPLPRYTSPRPSPPRVVEYVLPPPPPAYAPPVSSVFWRPPITFSAPSKCDVQPTVVYSPPRFTVFSPPKHDRPWLH